MPNRMITDMVLKELEELAKLGVNVPIMAYQQAREHAVEYFRGGMNPSEIADQCILLGFSRRIH